MLQAVGSQKNILEKGICSLSQPPFASTLPGRGPVVVAPERNMLFLPACRAPGGKEKQHRPQGYQQHTPSSTLHNMGDPSRRPPRLDINSGTILTKLKAAEETPGSRLGSLPGLPHTSHEYHPLLRALSRGLQDPIPCRRAPEHPACCSSARRHCPHARSSTSIGCCWTLA